MAIPRGDRVQLRGPTAGSDEPSNAAASELVVAQDTNASNSQQVKLLPLNESLKSAAWFGQTLEYAAGVYLREFVLDPILRDGTNGRAPDETARLLSCNAQGNLLFLKTPSGVVHMGSIARVTSSDGPTLATWWELDKVLPYTESLEWSDWWVKRCHAFDPGCEMIKLLGEDGGILGVAYFERSIVDKYSEGKGKRITLIRGIRVCPKFNPESFRRSSHDRQQPIHSVLYPTVPSILLFHILYASLRFGVQGVATNCPKADSVEDFYEQYMGLPYHIDCVTGRRFYRLDDRIDVLQLAFREQLDLILQYKDQMGMASDTQEEGDTDHRAEGAQPGADWKPGEVKSTDEMLVIGTEGGCTHGPTDGPLHEQDVELLEDGHVIQAVPKTEAENVTITSAEIDELHFSKALTKRLLVDIGDAATNSEGEIKKHKLDPEATPTPSGNIQEASKESKPVAHETTPTGSERKPKEVFESEKSDDASEAANAFEDAS